MAGILDIFDGDAFNMRSLTLAIDKLPYKPQRLAQLGLFESKPQLTQHVTIEDQEGILSILPVQPRNSYPMTAKGATRRKIKSWVAPTVPDTDSVFVSDLQGRRAFATEDQLETMAQVVNSRLEDLKNNHEVTLEYHRIGALNGKVLDADGSTVLYDYFADWNISQISVTVDFTDTGTPAAPNYTVDMKILCQGLLRTMQDALGNTTFSGIHIFCGNKFWDSFITHGSVRRAYEFRETGRQSDFLGTTQIPTSNQMNPTFDFGGCTWENYRGVVGGIPFFPDFGAVAVPTGVKGMFLECPCPADFEDTVNTLGKPIYVKQERMKWDAGIEILTVSHVLHVATRPRAIIQLNGANAPTWAVTPAGLTS